MLGGVFRKSGCYAHGYVIVASIAATDTMIAVKPLPRLCRLGFCKGGPKALRLPF